MSEFLVEIMGSNLKVALVNCLEWCINLLHTKMAFNVFSKGLCSFK